MRSARRAARLGVAVLCSLEAIKGRVASLTLCSAALALASVPLLIVVWLLYPNPMMNDQNTPPAARPESLARRLESLAFVKLTSDAFAQACVQADFAEDCAQQRRAKQKTNRQQRTSKRKRFKPPHRRKNPEPILVKDGEPAPAYVQARKAIP
jgi:hypothetical protein